MAKKTVATMTTASEKIKLNPLTPFTRKRSDFILFMQDVYVYLKVNKMIYNNNEKKISFILSYLAGGDAAVWKQQFIQTKIEESEEAKNDEPNWGTYKEFVTALKKTFQPYDKLAEALEDIKKLCLGDGSIMEHNSKFHLLMSQNERFPGFNGLIPGDATLGPTEPDHPIQTPVKDTWRVVYKSHKLLRWTSKGAMPF
jgi:Retrotransposon gag protein